VARADDPDQMVKVEGLAVDFKYARDVVIRIKPENISETVAFLGEKWKEFAPDLPFDYSFFDDALEELYTEEQRFGKIISLFTLFAVFIGSIGLFGLSLFIGEQRVKEISSSIVHVDCFSDHEIPNPQNRSDQSCGDIKI
jgi:hypothetical protein